MRRVNEVMREVIGSAISSDLQDPRIGFVTVTAVDTSPTFAMQSSTSACSAPRTSASARLAALRSAHGVLQAAINSELRLKRTPTLRFAYDESVERADRITRMLDRRARTDVRGRAPGRVEPLGQRCPGDGGAAGRSPTACAAIERFLLTTHEGPDGDALGSLLGLHGILTQLGKDSVMFLAEKEFPLPVEYRFMPLQEVFHEPPADLADRTVVFLDCGNIDRMPVEWLRDGADILNIDHHHDNTRFGSLNLVDDEAACTAEIIFELAGLLGAEITARDRDGALRRPDHRHRHVHVREHRRALPPGRGGADRGRRRRQRDLPPPLRAGPDGEAAAARAGARPGRASPRRQPLDRLRLRRRLRGDRRRRDADRGHHRLRPGARGHRGGRGDPRQAEQRRTPPARRACVRPTAPSTSPRSPARWAVAGTGAPPASPATSATTS